MEAYESIKKLDDIIALGDEKAIRFANEYGKQMKNKLIGSAEFKQRFGFNITQLRDYLKDKYKTHDGEFDFTRPKNPVKEESTTLNVNAIMLERLTQPNGDRHQVSKIMYDDTLNRMELVYQKYPNIDKKDLMDICLKIGMKVLLSHKIDK